MARREVFLMEESTVQAEEQQEESTWLQRFADSIDFVDVILALIIVVGLIGAVVLTMNDKSVSWLMAVITTAVGYLIGRNASL